MNHLLKRKLYNCNIIEKKIRKKITVLYRNEKHCISFLIKPEDEIMIYTVNKMQTS